MSQQDDLWKKLGAVVGFWGNINDLWDRYLIARGWTTGSLNERQRKDAASRGFTIQEYLRGAFDETPPTVPDAPTNVVATRTGSGQITFTFNPPVNDGGATITQYRIITTPGSFIATGTASPIVVTGLANGTSYTGTARATNSVGNSAESSASNAAVPSTVPGAPTIGTATAGVEQVSVTFTAPGNDGSSPILNYTVQSVPAGFSAVGASSPIVVTGITPNVAYTFTVKATNANGDSALSAQSNSVTPTAGSGPAAGPFDSLYAPNWMPVEDAVVRTPPVLTQPSKSTGISSPSYTDSNYGTKIFRVANLSDSPGNSGNKMRHEYSRRQPFNCDSTRFMIQNTSGFYFLYDADTFQQIDGGISTADAKLEAVGTNTIYPKDPRDWIWHPTDPNKIYFKSQADNLNIYMFDVVTKVLTTAGTMSGKLAAVGMGTGVNVESLEGRPSDDGRYWSFIVKNSSDACLGYICYDLQTDSIVGSLVTSVNANNCTMSSKGNYVVISAGGSMTMENAAASPTLTGTRAYTRNFSSFRQILYTTTHTDVGIDHLGQEVVITLNPGGSSWGAVPSNSVYYMTCAGSEPPHMLIDLGNASSQWNNHVSACNTPNRPGWCVFSMYDSQSRGARKYLDDNIVLCELKPSGHVYRLADHRTRRFTYWQEPQATISRDGLRVMYSCSWDSTSSTTPQLDYMIGLPSWVYGTPATEPPVTNEIGNGDFTTSTGWALGASCTISGGVLTCANNAANVTNTYAMTKPSGTYRVTYDIVGPFTAGNVTPRFTTSAGLVSGTTRVFGTAGVGTYVEDIVCTGSITDFNFRVTRTGAAMQVSLDNVVIEKIA